MFTGIMIVSLIALLVLGLASLAPAMAEPALMGTQDSQLVLQASVTKTATFNSTGLDLGSGYAPGGAGQAMQANIRVSALDISSTDETYAFKIQDSPDNSTWTDRSPSVSLTAAASSTAGVFGIICGITQRYVRLVMTAGGTTPSITYEAWLSPYVLAAA